MRNWRINIAFTIFFIFSATIISRLVFIQILEGNLYRALSQGLHASFSEGQEDRGEIFLRGGESLAINKDWPFVFAHPQRIKDTKETASALSPILNLKESLLLDKLDKDNSYSLLKRKLTEKEVQSLKALDLEGIYINSEKGRYYPQETLASQIVGFLGAEGKGQYGLEQYYNDALEGKKGLIISKKGSDLNLTIDYSVQFKAGELLKKAKEDLNIEGGQIIVVDPISGAVLAMADLESFNPNYYEQYAKEGGLEIFKNRATQGLFEPGSVFKAITMAAALEENRVSPKTTYIDTGMVKIDGYPIYNYDQRIHDGPQTMTNVLEKSINTGAIFVQKELGQSLFLKYVEGFGFFEPSGIDVQETYSQNRELKTARAINLATASFGQGIDMTPIQLVKAYCAIANGGKLINPYLVEELVNLKETINNYNQEKKEETVISSKTASQLTAMLVSVVENGFAKGAKIPGYFIAGKTGTAQVSFGALGINKKGYSEKTIQTFIGFGPAFDAKFLILVKLNNPQTKTAEYSALPIFRELTEYIIHHYQIPPDYEE